MDRRDGMVEVRHSQHARQWVIMFVGKQHTDACSVVDRANGGCHQMRDRNYFDIMRKWAERVFDGVGDEHLFDVTFGDPSGGTFGENTVRHSRVNVFGAA